MLVPRRQPKLRVWSWFTQLWHGGKRRPARRRTPIVLELLEDRLNPTTLTDASGVLTVTLDNPGDTFTINATGTNQYHLTSTNGSAASDLLAAGLTGATFNAGTSTLSLNGDSAIQIVDLATGGSVAFNDSGTNTYAKPIAVTLTQPLSAGVTFNNTSNFAAGLTVFTTDGNIVGATGSSISVTGDLSLTAPNIALAGTVTVSGETGLHAGGTISVIPTAGSNSFGGDVAINGTLGLGTTATSAGISAGGALAFNDVELTGGLNVTGAGSITQTAGTSISVGGAASFTTSTGDITLSSTSNAFGGDLGASVQGAGNVQLDNGAATTTLGTIHLGTGNLTVNEDDFTGFATIAEDTHAGGITTAAGSTATLAFALTSDENGTIDLSGAANDFAGTTAVVLNPNMNIGVGSFLLTDVRFASEPDTAHLQQLYRQQPDAQLPAGRRHQHR